MIQRTTKLHKNNQTKEQTNKLIKSCKIIETLTKSQKNNQITQERKEIHKHLDKLSCNVKTNVRINKIPTKAIKLCKK